MRDRGRRIYGRGGRVGLIVPTTNTVNEAEWREALPRDVTLHVARMALHLDTATDAGRRQLEDDIVRAARDLADAEVDVVAYGCTAGSMTLPLDALPSLVSRAVGVPGVATAPAIVDALRALGARRVAVATPYADTLNEHERGFLEACGFAVVALRGLGLGAGGAHEYRAIHVLDADAVRNLARSVAAPGADALVLSCTDLPTRRVHGALERELGLPVVTSNQATLWAALRAGSVSPDGVRWGRLLPGAAAHPSAA